MTDYDFTLPRGYRDRDGNLHRQGVMRRQIVADEMMPLRDKRVPPTPEELFIYKLSCGMVQLGTLKAVSREMIEEMSPEDRNYLQDVYNRIHAVGGG